MVTVITVNTALTIVRSWRRTLSIHIQRDGSILVKAPYLVSDGSIHSFVHKHADWIQKKQAVLEKSHHTLRKKYQHGEPFLFLGERYALTIGDYPAIEMQQDKLFFPQFLQFRIRKEIETWYVQQARRIIKRQVEWYAQQMHVSYISISYSDTSSKWGSCTHNNRLQFNWRLIMAPLSVVDYLVVHELAHIREKNHSRRFWNIVKDIHPSYREDSKWLKKNGDTLTL